MTELISGDVWEQIKRCWSSHPRFVCTPYYSCDDGTELADGDILIVSATDQAIMSGTTSAAALRRAFQNGAQIWSHPDLHAKVYVLGADVFIGSANASVHSRKVLIECLVRASDSRTVGQAISFIMSVTNSADRVDEKFLSRIERLPVTRPIAFKRQRPEPPQVKAPRCWLLGISDYDYYPGDDTGHVKTTRELQGSVGQSQKVYWFWWRKSPSLFYRDVEQGDTFVGILRRNLQAKTSRGVEVYPPTSIVRVSVDDRGRKVFHYARPKRSRRAKLSWPEFRQLLQQIDWNVTPSVRGCRLIPDKDAVELERLWPR